MYLFRLLVAHRPCLDKRLYGVPLGYVVGNSDDNARFLHTCLQRMYGRASQSIVCMTLVELVACNYKTEAPTWSSEQSLGCQHHSHSLLGQHLIDPVA